MTVLKTTRAEQCTQEETQGNLSRGCPAAVPSQPLSPTEVCVGGNLAGHICLPGVERSCHVGLTPASAIARRRPELSPKTLKMCPSGCKPTMKRLQKEPVCPDQDLPELFSPARPCSLLLTLRDTSPLLVEKQGTDRAVNAQISQTGRSPAWRVHPFPQMPGKEERTSGPCGHEELGWFQL